MIDDEWLYINNFPGKPVFSERAPMPETIMEFMQKLFRGPLSEDEEIEWTRRFRYRFGGLPQDLSESD